MKVRLLGTGAADGIPAYYSDSEVSRHARIHGGKDIRSRSSALIDGVIKIDLGPDSLWQIARDRLDARDWTALIYTHSHDDHFVVEELQYGLYPFNDCECLGYTIFGNAEICRRISERYPDWPMEIIQTRSFECFRHGEYLITPVHAYHKIEEDAHNLIFQSGDKSFFYATDTGIWQPPTWEFLSDYKIDAMVIECTEGLHRTAYYGHLDIKECVEVVGRLKKMGVLKEDALVVTTHHSHMGGANHEELVEMLSKHHIDVGFDGMEFEV